MVFFKNKTIYLTEKRKTKNKVGQLIEGYKKVNGILVNLQPIDEKAIKYTFGEDIKATYQIYTEENIQVNDILVFDDKTYKIEKKIDWLDYKCYALLESEVVLLEESK